VQNGASPASPSTNDGSADGEARSGRRSRGRGRGRGRSDEGSTTEVAASGAVVATLTDGAAMPAAFAETAIPVTAVASTAELFAVEPAAVAAPPASAPLPVEAAAPAVAEAAAPAPVEVAAPVAAEAVAPAPVVVEPAPRPAAVPEPVVVAMPPPAADPIIVSPAPQPAAVDVKESLQQVGLVMIETSHAAPAADSFAPAQPLGRKPKPAPVIASEPLQMVETKHD
jgi:ribonuclease E